MNSEKNVKGATIPSPHRVLVIGLDMGDGALIRSWSQKGFLPSFASLASSGAWLTLESTADVLHTSTWPTFATGTLPGQHGIYYPYQPKPGYQLAQYIQPDQYGAPTFWKIADEQQRRCLVYDIPETFLESGFQGRAVFEWGTFAQYGKPCSHPQSLLKKLKSQFGVYPLGFEAKRLGAGFPDVDLLEERLLRSVAYKSETMQWLMDDKEWDLAVIGFGETHPAGHYLWSEEADAFDHDEATDFSALMNVYSALDKAIGQLTASLPDNTVVIVTSGDGIGPNRCGWHLLPEALERLGYTCASGSSGSSKGGPSEPEKASKSSLLGNIKGLLPQGAKRWISDSLPWWLRDRLVQRMQNAKIDWTQTRAFALPSDLEGCIRINLKGREPNGIVEPGVQYAELCQELTEQLKALTHPSSGAPAVRQVFTSREVFPGDRQDQLPDIIVKWNDSEPFDALQSPVFGVIEQASPDPRIGTHSTNGFLLASGTAIPHGIEGRGHLIDIAPTVLNLLSIPPPQRPWPANR